MGIFIITIPENRTRKKKSTFQASLAVVNDPSRKNGGAQVCRFPRPCGACPRSHEVRSCDGRHGELQEAIRTQLDSQPRVLGSGAIVFSAGNMIIDCVRIDCSGNFDFLPRFHSCDHRVRKKIKHVATQIV